MTHLLIRPGAAADIPAITAIYAYAVRHGTASFELEPPDQAEMTRRRRTIVDSGYPYLVAERDGAVVGYAYASPYRLRPAYRWSVEDSIYVAPDATRLGTGTALLRELIVACEMRGLRQMIAVIGDSAQTPSIALHRQAGFRTVGTLTNIGFKFGRWLDSVLMQRALGPGAAEPPARNRHRSSSACGRQ